MLFMGCNVHHHYESMHGLVNQLSRSDSMRELRCIYHEKRHARPQNMERNLSYLLPALQSEEDFVVYDFFL